MQWEVLGYLSSHPKGDAVLALLERVRAKYADMGGNEMVTVLEGAGRQPIVRVRTQGLGAFMALVNGLQDLGFVDRLADQSQPERGVDAAFS